MKDFDKLKVTYHNIAELIPDPDNARQHDQRNIDAIKQSIQRFGIRKPVVAHEASKIVYAGNGVLIAALELGIETVPVAWIPADIPVEVAKAYSIFDNRTTDLSSFEPEKLSILLDELEDFDLDELLWTPVELDELLKDVENDNEQKDENFDIDSAIDGEAEPITKTGDIWLCGKHKVMAGDSTKAEDVEKLMDSKKADLLLTDPPYGDLDILSKEGYVGKDNVAKCKQYERYAGMGNFDLSPVLRIAEDYYKNAVIWGGNYFAHLLPLRTSWLVWDKRAGKHSWFSDCELAWTTLPIPARIFSHTWQGMIREGQQIDRVHPTQKPIELMIWILQDLQPDAKTVLDLFLGSGTTLIACEKLNRICYGMEISPQYCDVICKRYYEFTDKIPILESTGEPFLVEQK